jgi:transglutaminase-like putative cysteine protease
MIAAMTEPTRRVGARIVVRTHEQVHMMLQVAVSDTAPAQVDERLSVTFNGAPLEPTEVLVSDVGRVHLLDADPGWVTVEYEATVVGRALPAPVSLADGITYVRPSRYAESDRLGAIAHAEFAGIEGRPALLAAVSSWVGAQVSYVAGSSGPTDGAVDTLLQRQGVCRDYAHLVIALLRALDVPARLAAVYAPGLDPMDFHAVAEAAVDGQWRVVDATLLAPRESLLRIATGRDAADTAFLSIYGGAADLLESEVTAVVDGDLPIEDVHALVALG